MPETVRLSVIMPAFNEEGAIAQAIDDVQRHVLDAVPGSKLILVNDGSSDGTPAIIDRAAAGDRRIRVVHKNNGGHGSALLAGLGIAKGEYVFLIDSDRQIPLDQFPAAWAELVAGRDAVFGVRRRRSDPRLRLYLSGLVRRSISVLFNITLRDANAPFKLFRRAVWNDLRSCVPDGTLAPSLFFAIVAKSRGYNVIEIDVTHKERDSGEVQLRWMRLLKFCAAGFTQLVALRSRVA